MKYLRYLILIVLITSSCKSTRVAKETAALDVAKANVVSSYKANHFDFNTLASRIRIKYRDKRSSQSVTVSLRMEKDKKIWMSASILGISVAKALITPDRVAYYEKVSGTYFDGDFDFLSEYLGVELNFDQLQRMLIGQTLVEVKPESFLMTEDQGAYKFQPKREDPRFAFAFFLNPTRFLLEKQRVVQPEDALALQVSYKSYQRVQNQAFPEALFIEVFDQQDLTTIEIDYRSVEYNPSLRFPFSIPSGYKEIEL